jgi:hypothetical protein
MSSDDTLHSDSRAVSAGTEPAPHAAATRAAPAVVPVGIKRREMLVGAAATTLGFALPLRSRAAPEPEPEVRSYRALGKTGLTIADISFGSSRLSANPDVVRYALDRGINYFDTAESYRGGRSEEVLGEALQGVREKVILTSKVHCGADTTRAELSASLEASLSRLRTDRVEIYLNHAVNDVDRLANPEWGEFVTRAKEQGKIRFTGMSGHSGRLAECLRYGFDRELFDVILVAYNFGQDPSFVSRFTRGFDTIAIQPELPTLIAEAKANGVGVIAMKTLMGAKLNDMREYERDGGTFAQAAFRWVLANPDVDALIVSMTEKDQIAEFLRASGDGAVRESDVRLLQRYVALHGASYCRFGCNGCAGACPEGVSISEVLRTRMYAVDYGDLELGRHDYALIGQAAAKCSGCTHQACAGSCTYGLDTVAMAREAHSLLA